MIEQFIKFQQAAGLAITHCAPEQDNEAYGAHTFCVNNQSVRFRIAKKTPTKTGFFVTIWKRSAEGIIPFHSTDPMDFLVIAVEGENYIGAFIFPKLALVAHKLLSTEQTEGKRGTRVYTPFDVVTSRQAQLTQQWQSSYFVNFDEDNAQDQLIALYASA